MPCSIVAPVSGSIRPYAPCWPLSPATTSTRLPPIVSHAAPDASGTGVESANGTCVHSIETAGAVDGEGDGDGDGDGDGELPHAAASNPPITPSVPLRLRGRSPLTGRAPLPTAARAASSRSDSRA